MTPITTGSLPWLRPGTVTACIMQPTYLPWLGYFDLLDQADVFIFDDLAPVNRKSWQTRNRIRGRDGKTVWLSVPITAHQGSPLNEVKIANEHDWEDKHLRIIQSAYGHAPFYDTIAPLFGKRWWPNDQLSARTFALTLGIGERLGVRCRTFWTASKLARLRHGRIERLADMLQAVEATDLLDTAGARDVLGVDEIEGVPIRWHQYEHPVYDQGGAEFMPHLSVVDLLAWHGPASLGIIRSGRA